MLVLSRKEGDRILIGDEIELVILKSNSGKMKIGINAPQEISVRRHELAEVAGQEESFLNASSQPLTCAL